MRMWWKRCCLLLLCMAFVMGSLSGYPVNSAISNVDPAVSFGKDFVVALSADGNVYAWGANSYGVLGAGDASKIPVAVKTSGVRFRKIDAGYSHVVALSVDGKVYTWGNDEYGQLGNRTDETVEQARTVPTLVEGNLAEETIVDIAAGDNFSMALTSNGKVYIWGTAANGILGKGDTDIPSNACKPHPLRVAKLDSVYVTAVFAGESTAAIIDGNGQVYLWGKNDTCQVTSSSDYVGVPTQRTSSTAYNASFMALGAGHSVYLMNDFKVKSHGSSAQGQLGDGSNSNYVNKLKEPSNLTDQVLSIAAGSKHTVALTKEGKVYAWGDNSTGQLGVVITEDTKSLVPQEVGAGLWTEASAVFAGYNNTAVIDDAGMVYIFGNNSNGQVGNDTVSESVTTPTMVKDTSGTGNLCLGSVDFSYEQKVTISVHASVPKPTFTVSIPATIEVGKLKQELPNTPAAVKSTVFSVTASNVDNLFNEKQIVVSVSGTDGVFALYDEDYMLHYEIYNTETGGEKLASGDVFATFTQNGAQVGRLDIDQSQITRKGSYSGTVIFDVRVTNIEEGSGS